MTFDNLVSIAAILFMAVIAAPIVAGFVKGLQKGIAKHRSHQTTPPPVTVSSPPHPCAVLHNYVPIDAQHIPLNDLPHTTVLFHCLKCGTHFTGTYLGKWAIEDFLKKESDVARDVRTLNGMVM